MANQDRQIIIAEKSEAESRARASADIARAEATKASEAIETVRALAEVAERAKDIAVIEARREAEVGATKGIRLAAEAERAAADDHAAALRAAAQGEADAMTIRASAKLKDLLAEAEGRQALANSENTLSAEIIAMRVALAKIEAMPRIVAEMVKPAEKIEFIRINQITGMGPGGRQWRRGRRRQGTGQSGLRCHARGRAAAARDEETGRGTGHEFR